MDFEVAIIGGGLAGLGLAIQLSKAGHRVILFEKEQYPFHKVCGEYISMESWDFLESLGIPLDEMKLPRITRLHISDCNGRVLQQKLNPGGFGISRYTLDDQLAAIAKLHGTELMQGVKVSDIQFENDQHYLKTSSGDFTAKVVCGAWGKRSNLDIKLKRPFIENTKLKTRQYIGVKYHVKLDFPKDLIELHNFEDGYCGISAVDNNRFCLCYLTTAQQLQQNQNNIKRLEDRVLKKNPLLDNYFSNADFLYEEPLAISQISFARKQAVEDYIFMAGDSAGMITPLCGNGMSMALHASKLLNIVLTDYLNGSISRTQAEKQYDQLWRENFSTRLSAGRVFQKLFGNPTVTNLTLKSLSHLPALASKLIDLTHGGPF
ncbi:FAD-dependent oxidoreductase [Solitalea sp. MAHUQ-68]|uniref:FAD-dependent oxidoreductase n=1 Tax=Solitalea agri TaxID=2953739 RepID=A0A9X2F2K7_9SPHI|nr:FAD-dependent oxidoreductase [Solitalea agri]MCO4293549.1 FAD-dependent oxidoreductase [Solitalea agri]